MCVRHDDGRTAVEVDRYDDDDREALRMLASNSVPRRYVLVSLHAHDDGGAPSGGVLLHDDELDEVARLDEAIRLLTAARAVYAGAATAAV